MATPRGITQPHTSFIGSACQGIHHTPVTKHTDTQTITVNNTKTQKRKILASTIQFSHNTTPTRTSKQPPPAHDKGPTRTHKPVLPQTPNSAPMLSNLLSRTTCASPTQHHTANNPPTGSTPHDHPRSRNQPPQGARPPGNTYFMAVAHSATSTTQKSPQL